MDDPRRSHDLPP
jgi:hypothetical protein